MALLQNEDFTIYHLRTACVSTIKDGVGERLITVNPAVFNTPGFRSAGWYPDVKDIKRTYSPPIPTAIASEYFQAPPRSAGLSPVVLEAGDDVEGGLVTGGGRSADTVGPGPISRRRRRREQMEEDSSDLSDDSEDGDGMQRAAQQIKFAKMPVRTRSGSSPIRGSNVREGPSLLVTSPSRPSPASRLRRGSLGAVEAAKQRARRNTTTSSDMSSDNELDPIMFQRKQINPSSAARVPRALENDESLTGPPPLLHKESTDLEDEDEVSGEESDGSALSSDFEQTSDSPSFLNEVGVAHSSIPSPISRMGGVETIHDKVYDSSSPKKARQDPNLLQALPPPRPISTIQPVSALSMAIKAKRSKSESPFDRFANLSGKGDPNPLNLRIYAPFSKNATKPYEVPMRRVVSDDSGVDRKITVVDAIGLSLWRYAEEMLQPELAKDKMDVNRWTLRMVEDDEVDFDFPALERIKPMTDFTSNNNRAARSRSNTKSYDEFALVEADQQQYQENQRLTPNPVQEAPKSITEEPDNDRTPQPSPGAAITQSCDNPLLKPNMKSTTAMANGRNQPLFGASMTFSSTITQTRLQPGLGPSHNASSSIPRALNPQNQPVDLPRINTSHATPRTGPSRIIKIHLTSPEGYPELVALDVTSDTYLAEVLDMVCRKRNLDRAHHILKISETTVIAPLDRVVESLGDHSDIDLVRRRFGNDGVGMIAGSPGSSTPPNAPLFIDGPDPLTTFSKTRTRTGLGGMSKRGMAMGILHPLNTSSSAAAVIPSFSYSTNPPAMPAYDPVFSHASANYQKFTVWRKQPMSFMPTHERIIALDGEYLHLMPGESGKSTIFDSGGKTTTIHFSTIIGCKCSRKHPSNFTIVVARGVKGETKRYDFEARTVEEAREIVGEVRRGMGAFGEGKVAMP